MKKLFTFLCLLILLPAVWAKHVPQKDAQQFAITFYRLNNPFDITDPLVQSATVKSWDDVASFYIFRFVSGGFVLVAADDASIPILGYSFENDMPEVIDNPAVKEWLDNYSSEISYIISNKLDNAVTLKGWRSIQKGKALKASTEVLPLLTTVWDQGCYYDEMCPSDPEGPCNHTVTGCVATAMAQIMKYHNFPPQGVGEHAYIAAGYGQQSADFGNTTYDWSSMPDSVAGSNPAVATLNYHAGVSVDMGYSAVSSGAFDVSIPVALLDYFNYSPDIELISKASFPDVEDFKNLLRTDLDAHLPVCYGGSNPTGSVGHEFVCDGYRMSDSTFHFNWGWAGFANGYYAIGNLNPGGNNWDYNNNIVVHIKPYNPDLIVRITHPAGKTVASVGDTVQIKAKVIRGSVNLLRVFIDDVERISATVDSVSFTWNITSNDLGSHIVKAYAYNASDTVYYKEQLNVSEWITQSSGFPTGSVPVYYMSAIDSNVVWGSDQNGSQFTRTVDGGSAWTPGIINNTTGLGSSMIFGLDSLKAFVAMWRFSGNKPMGIYMTSDGGISWVHQASASFSNPASYPDFVHFFNANDGVTMGDPINNEFEIYTTTNGGNIWTPVPAANIPDPITSEMGIIGYYSAIHDTIWFGTSKGRVYKSVNKGLNWTVSAAAAMAGKLVKPTFRNGSHGLLLDGLWGAGVLCETFDGGNTWTQVDYTGSNFRGDIEYVPGTSNTWVRSGYDPGNSGCSYSFDGGHTWTDFIGTNGTPYYPMAWVNNHCGWAGGVNLSPTAGGVYKYIGSLVQLLSPQDVLAIADNHIVDITWSAPAYNPEDLTLLGYNISRNNTTINSGLVTNLTYTDGNVPNGLYTYCVSAMYDLGPSPGSCNTVDVAVGIVHPVEKPVLLIYPNPAHGRVMVKTGAQSAEISILDLSGKAMPVAVQNLQSGFCTIDISALSQGIYLVTVKTTEGIARNKLVVY
jgi:photosystem II stability/assembly factor-like uncharacterized protein